jgi:hypothetical protein
LKEHHFQWPPLISTEEQCVLGVLEQDAGKEFCGWFVYDIVKLDHVRQRKGVSWKQPEDCFWIRDVFRQFSTQDYEFGS